MSLIRPANEGIGPAEAETRSLLDDIHTPPDDPLGRLTLRLSRLTDMQAVVQRGGVEALAQRIVDGLRADDGLRMHYRDLRCRDIAVGVMALGIWTAAVSGLSVAIYRGTSAPTVIGPVSEDSARILHLYGGPDGLFSRCKERAVPGGGIACDMPPIWLRPPVVPRSG